MSANKIDVSTICEMFEKIKEKLDKQTTSKPIESAQVDLSLVNAMTENGLRMLSKKPENQLKCSISTKLRLLPIGFFFHWW